MKPSEIKYSPSGKAYVESSVDANGDWSQKTLGLAPDEARRQGWQPIAKLAPPGMFPPTVYGYEAKDVYEQDLSDEFSAQAAGKKSESTQNENTSAKL